jgi:hypothetical protein
VFGADDLIGEGRVDISQVISDVGETKRRMGLTKKYIEQVQGENKRMEKAAGGRLPDS